MNPGPEDTTTKEAHRIPAVMVTEEAQKRPAVPEMMIVKEVERSPAHGKVIMRDDQIAMESIINRMPSQVTIINFSPSQVKELLRV
jgi:hypothetical protein